MIQLLYYAYVGISSLHHQFVSSKANGLVATAPPRPAWPQLIRFVDVPNWVEDIYLTLGIITTSIYSRFAKSEFNCQHGAHHIAFPRKFPPFQSPSRPETIPLDRTSRWSICCCSFSQFSSVNLSTAPRFTKPGSSSITMVHDTVRPLFLLRPVARTIPPLRGHSLVFPRFPHHSYFNIQSAFPFGFSPLPIYSDKNPHHKRELKLPRMTIHNTMPTKKSKGRAPAANGNRTVPPPLPARQH
jgi:hypothetical protein